ncbi:BCNT-domain-containing protein [Hypoxylon trugodes]|uniref:BCNT-domain-containing protein n=1 Tax=Hypoxylon trugodes TaxID=326681 RepID=UPI00219814F0|nr:BCNT-domain-containing protein [Hypoxylon trugodes]KAI1384585.1 BCNT-domain-containing protein [Hypoxylon trugodes]
MAQEQLIDEDYASEEDSDFAPDAAPQGDGAEASESEDEEVQLVAVPNRKRSADAAAGDEDFGNSGDEAIIQRGKKRQKKSKRKDGSAEDDEGGEGGLIKTRSMRANEKAEKKTRVVNGPVTVDVDDLWAKMTADPVIPSKTDAEKENQRPTQDESLDASSKGIRDKSQTEKPGPGEPGAMIKIKRTYNFAGKVHTEEKLVPRDSAEATLYLASQDPKAAAEAEAEDGQPRRKPRKAFRSIFEPVIEGISQRADLNLGMTARLKLREQAKAKKLNVVEKSRMDWAGFVDKEGIKDELELAGKSKESFVNRQDFLARVAANKDEEARRARIAGRV